MPDWTGNKVSVYANLAASSHSEQDREKDDYYATPPKAVEALLQREKFNHYVLEPAVGGAASLMFLPLMVTRSRLWIL